MTVTVIASVEDLTVTDEHGRAVLDRVDLQLEPGVTAVVGESGAGKTTLAQALVGYLANGLQLRSGAVAIEGRYPFTAVGKSQLRGRLTGYLPQDPASALDPRRAIRAQLRVAARVAYRGSRRSEREASISAAIDAADFSPHLLRRLPGELSGGQAQRALLAWAFISRPRLLILDEPTSGLDSDTARRVSRSFTSLPWNPAVLLISHDRELTDRVAERVFELRSGRLHSIPTRLPEPSASVLNVTGASVSAKGRGRRDREVVVERMRIRRGGDTLLTATSLHFSTGELVALRGLSGAGKTAVAKALCGLEAPESGSLLVRGMKTSWQADQRVRSRGPFIAYVGQDARAALNPHETLGAALIRATRSARRRDISHGAHPATEEWSAATLMKRLALPFDALERTPDRLSGGQRHRAALARALAARPDMLVLDETLAALDRSTALLVLDTLEDWRGINCAPVLLITHQDAVADRADRVLTLSERRIT